MLIKNAIVLIDETDSSISEGKARMDTVVDAAVSRVRPVSLGMLTTVLGVTPLIWDPFFNSLAVVIICGLSSATALTLIVVPVLCAIFFRIQEDEVSFRLHPENGADGQRSGKSAPEPGSRVTATGRAPAIRARNSGPGLRIRRGGGEPECSVPSSSRKPFGIRPARVTTR